MNRALFLDRDGVLDELMYYPALDAWEAPRRPEDVHVIDGVPEALARLTAAGWLLVIVTNQPDWAKAKTTREALVEVHEKIVREVEAAGARIARSYLCFHHPEGVVPELRVACDCRKPGTASLLAASRELDVDLTASWMVGDQDSDLACGRAAGCRIALVEHVGSSHKRGTIEPDLRCEALGELVDYLLRLP